MNKGIELSSGQYLLFMNGGDMFYAPESLEQAVHCGITEPLVVGGVEIRYPDAPSTVRTYSDHTFPVDYLYWRSLRHQACLIRRDRLKKAGGYDTGFEVLGDWIFFASEIVACKTPVQILPCMMSIFYHDGLSAQASGTKLYRKERGKIRSRYYSPSYRLRRELNEFIGRFQRKCRLLIGQKTIKG